MPAGTQEKPRLNETIEVNGAFAESNDARHDPAELRRRVDASGYLFFRGLANKAQLLELRRTILELCREHGFLDPKAPLMDGIYRGGPFPDNHREYMPMYRKLQATAVFNEFSRSKEIMALFGDLLGGEVLAHPRNIARVSWPGDVNNTTQAHQDFHYIRGTPETFTAWIPCGDCPPELGGICVLEGSHRQGFIQHVPAVGAGGNGIATRGMPYRWLSTDYRAGDVVLFHSYTIHGALPNLSPNRLRLSLDYRYQRADQEVDPSSLVPHLTVSAKR